MFFWKKKEVKMKNEFKVGDIVIGVSEWTRGSKFKVVELLRDGMVKVVCSSPLSPALNLHEDDVVKQTERDLDNFIDKVNSEFLNIINGASKPKLKIKLYNEGNVVIYRVLEQSEDLRCNEIVKRSFTASNGFGVTSDSIPMIGSDYISIRGYLREHDDFVDRVGFDSEKEAEEYVRKALEALQEFSDINYFQGDKEKTYEF